MGRGHWEQTVMKGRLPAFFFLFFQNLLAIHIIIMETAVLPTCNHHPAKSLTDSILTDILGLLFS